MLSRQVEREPDELCVAGGERVVIGGPVDKIVGKISSPLGGALDVVDGEIEFLEGEASDLANHAGDQLIRGLRQWMPPRPGRRRRAEALRCQDQQESAARRRSPAACRRSWGQAS